MAHNRKDYGLLLVYVAIFVAINLFRTFNSPYYGIKQESEKRPTVFLSNDDLPVRNHPYDQTYILQ